MVAMSQISLREITKDSLSSILKIKVRPDQEKFVANNAISIAQAHFHDDAWFRGIYSGDDPVGFVMLSLIPEKGEYFVWRFLIGEPFQRQGYGCSAMNLVVDYVRTLPDAEELYVSHIPGEGSPGPFYEKLGFVYTGEEDEAGERMMKLDLGS